jgi:hypothetical protein
MIVDYGKFKHLTKEGIVKARWLEKRKSLEELNTMKQMNFTEDTTMVEGDLLSMSNIVLIISNSFLLLANLIVLANLLPNSPDEYILDKYTDSFLGIGCSMAWVNILTVISKLKTFIVVQKTILNSLQGITKFLIGMLPLFLGFLFSSFCIFHEQDRFSTLNNSNIALSALLAGDEIQDFINTLMNYGAFGTIYAMAFCILFLVCIHNVFIFIITEAFKEETSDENERQRILKLQRINEENRNPKAFKQEDEIDKNSSDGRLLFRSVISPALNKQEAVLEYDSTNGVKKKIYNKIIPQSEDTIISAMNAKKKLLREDIYYLKESFNNLLNENVGKRLLPRKQRQGKLADDRRTVR